MKTPETRVHSGKVLTGCSDRLIERKRDSYGVIQPSYVLQLRE